MCVSSFFQQESFTKCYVYRKYWVNDKGYTAKNYKYLESRFCIFILLIRLQRHVQQIDEVIE